MGNNGKAIGRGIALLLCGAWLLTASGAMAARVNIAAVVGDDIITSLDVSERRDLIMATSGIPVTVENQQKITPRILQSLIDEALQMQEAKRQSVTVSDEELAGAIAEMTTTPARGSIPLRDFVTKNGLAMRSVESQVRAQLAWNKVVQRKLRRNVSISQDEVARAQQAEAAAPGETEMRIASIGVTIAKPEAEAAMTKLAEQIALELKSGADISSIAARFTKQREVIFEAPVWVPESALPPALQQTLRVLAPGETTAPLRNSGGIQIFQLLERKTAVKQDDSTEYAIKQILVPVPKKRDKALLAKLKETSAILRSDPGSCDDEGLPVTPLAAAAKLQRVKHGALNPDQRTVLGRLEVGAVSEPLMAPEVLRLVMLCEKIEPSAGSLPDAEKVRQQLFAEKIELEAQKHLRNLRRDAYIDIKGAQ